MDNESHESQSFLEAEVSHLLADAADCELVEMYVSTNNQAAVETLIRRHAPMVSGVIRRIIPTSSDADDVFQATFLVFLKSAKKIKKHSSVAAWLYGVAYRTACRARLRLHGSKTIGIDSTAIASQDYRDPLTRISEQFQLELLDRELEQLSSPIKETLIDHHLLGYTASQIADRMDVSISAVEGRLRRGRAALRHALSRRGVSFSVAAVLAAKYQTTCQAATGVRFEHLLQTDWFTHAIHNTSHYSVPKSLQSLATKDIATVTKTLIPKFGLASAIAACSVAAVSTPILLTAQSGRPHTSILIGSANAQEAQASDIALAADNGDSGGAGEVGRGGAPGGAGGFSGDAPSGGGGFGAVGPSGGGGFGAVGPSGGGGFGAVGPSGGGSAPAGAGSAAFSTPAPGGGGGSYGGGGGSSFSGAPSGVGPGGPGLSSGSYGGGPSGPGLGGGSPYGGPGGPGGPTGGAGFGGPFEGGSGTPGMPGMAPGGIGGGGPSGMMGGGGLSGYGGMGPGGMGGGMGGGDFTKTYKNASGKKPDWLARGEETLGEAEQAREEVRAKLRTKITPEFNSMPLRSVISLLSETSGVVIGTSLYDPDQGGATTWDEPVTLSNTGSISLQRTLQMISASTDDPFTYVVEPEGIQLVPKGSDIANQRRYYDLSYIVSDDQEFTKVQEAISILEDVKVVKVGSMLVVTAEETQHLEIEELLAEIARMPKENL